MFFEVLKKIWKNLNTFLFAIIVQIEGKGQEDCPLKWILLEA